VLGNTQGRPLLVEGPAGAGKTAVIEAAAAATGNHDRLVLHLDDQADSKSLLGQYVCGPAPGQFRWQPGSFTQAVVRGLWVVIEDVDAAPPEILAALAPLLHHRRLLLPGSGVTLHAAPGFQVTAPPLCPHTGQRERERESGPRRS
jgi:midasin